jgi:hypothetical protein
MIYTVSIKYTDTGDHQPEGTEITVRGATAHEANERLQALIDWLPDHMSVVWLNAVSLYV